METDYEALIYVTVHELFTNLEKRFDHESMERIRAGFAFAKEAHKTQKRNSGEPYIFHPIAVARIIGEELMLGADTIIAAFLHDVVEDTEYTAEHIEASFGPDVKTLVMAVTKDKTNNGNNDTVQVGNYKRILDSINDDIRALLIKLADRLHNMRTLNSMKPVKQMKIAGETDYFYAPIANRLGLYHIKTELENLSFQYRCPREYELMVKMINEESERIRTSLEKFVDKVNSTLLSSGIEARCEIIHRKPYSIWRKMQSKCCDFYHVNGKHYIRIIYPDSHVGSDKDEALRIYSSLTDVFNEQPGSVANYISSPKENGYRSFHVNLLNDEGRWEEVHISSEQMVKNSHRGCTADRSDSNIEAWIEKFRSVLNEIKAHTHEIEYMDGVTTSFYNDDIKVYMPGGGNVILPKNATALDLAFHLGHNEGLHAHYARINGRLTSIKTVLRRSDIVSIGTNSKVKPQKDWLNHVLTFNAKIMLTDYFKNEKKPQFNRCPLCHPIPGDEVIGYKENDGTKTVHKRNCPIAIRLSAHNGDNICEETYEADKDFLYPVRIRMRGIDRYHLLSDLIKCITDDLQLSMRELATETIDHIASCTIDFDIHSMSELDRAMESIRSIEGVDEVSRIDIE